MAKIAAKNASCTIIEPLPCPLGACAAAYA